MRMSRKHKACMHNTLSGHDDTTDYFTPCACARGNNVAESSLGMPLNQGGDICLREWLIIAQGPWSPLYRLLAQIPGSYQIVLCPWWANDNNDNDDKTGVTLPLAHARGVNIWVKTDVGGEHYQKLFSGQIYRVNFIALVQLQQPIMRNCQESRTGWSSR